MTEATMTLPASRPKVHRLPQLPPQGRDSSPSEKPFPTATVRTAALGLVLTIALGVAILQMQPSNPDTAAPVTLPLVASNPSSQTIVIQGQSDAIVGQMAKIPAENEPITEVRSASDVDKNAGRELLNIVSKY